MCTVTVLREPGRLLVTMNRDEARVRGPELPPRLHRVEGRPAWLGPIDSDSGGTWMGVNDRGCAACLLNRYAPGDDDPRRFVPGHISRGGIIPAILSQHNAVHALAYVREQLDPEQYGSFTLVLATSDACWAFDWARGEGLVETTLEPPWAMLTSTALETTQVLEWRRDRFEQWLAAGAPFHGALPTIHLDRPAGREGWAILMDRSISATRSITQVEISPAATTLRYWPREDGQTAFGEPAVTAGMG